MSGKAQYNDELRLRLEGTMGPGQQKSPVEEIMDREEAEPLPATMRGYGWLVSAVLELIFADERPMDWRYAAKRGVGLLCAFAPGLMTNHHAAEGRTLDGLVLPGRFSPGALEALGVDEDTDRVLRGFLEWVYATKGKNGRKFLNKDWLKDGTRKFYILARGFHPQALKKEIPGHAVRGTWVGERMEDMTYHDFAVAFGEVASQAARARWSWRGKQILPEEVHVPFQKGRITVEKNRRAARGNNNRIKNHQHGQ